MTDAMMLLIGFILAVGMTYISFRANRFLPSFIAGVIWMSLGYMLLDFNLIFSICCIGMSIYLWIRSIIS